MKKTILISILLSTFVVPCLANSATVSNPSAVQYKSIDLGYSDDGATLVGLQDGGALYVGKRVYRFDLKNETWSQIASLNIPRGDHKSLLLNDGRVLVVGGYKVISDGLSPRYEYVYQPEIFDPKTGVWNLLPAHAKKYFGGAVIQVSDSKIVMFGHDENDKISNNGCGLRGTLNLSNLSWQEDESGPGIYCYSAAMQAYKLHSGNILLLSEVNDFHVTIYNPSTGQYLAAPSPIGNNGLSGMRSDGTVFVAVASGGSTWHEADEMKLLTYNEAQNKWIAITNLNRSRKGRNFQDGAAFGLPDGRFVLYSYRMDADSIDGDIYDPSTNQWASMDGFPMAIHSAPLTFQVILLPHSNKLLFPSELISF